jgi:hypothetical protein
MMFVLLATACGDDLRAKPDAGRPDAAIDAAPDAPTCVAPDKVCAGTCAQVATDEANCGDCGVVCKGGEACDSTCACPAPFLPATYDPQSFDMFMQQMGATIAIAPIVDTTGIHPFIVGYSAQTPRNMPIDMSQVALGSIPFVAAGYRLDLGTFSTDATYVMIDGTLRITKACDTEIEGRIQNAVFKGTTGGFQNPAVDPMGCTFTVPSLTFHVMTTACP